MELPPDESRDHCLNIPWQEAALLPHAPDEMESRGVASSAFKPADLLAQGIDGGSRNLRCPWFRAAVKLIAWSVQLHARNAGADRPRVRGQQGIAGHNDVRAVFAQPFLNGTLTFFSPFRNEQHRHAISSG